MIEAYDVVKNCFDALSEVPRRNKSAVLGDLNVYNFWLTNDMCRAFILSNIVFVKEAQRSDWLDTEDLSASRYWIVRHRNEHYMVDTSGLGYARYAGRADFTILNSQLADTFDEISLKQILLINPI